MAEPVYTPYDVSIYCSVTLSTVLTWMDQGQLVFTRTPDGYRWIQQTDLVDFLARNKFPIPEQVRKRTKRVLIVDDEPDLIRFIAGAIQALGKDIEVDSATNGFTAKKRLGSFSPTLVVLDLMIPGFNGFQLCQEIRANAKLNGTRVLAITGDNNPNFKQQILDSGADAFLAKPFTVQELGKTAEELLTPKQ